MRSAAPVALLLATVLALAGCAGPKGGGTGDGAKDGAGTAASPEPGADAWPAPASLAPGDRWFVAVQSGAGAAVLAERHRRRRSGDLLVEEVTWGRSFAEVAGAEHGVAQVFAVFLDAKGLSFAPLGADGAPAGGRALEVARPFAPGTAWSGNLPGTEDIAMRIAGIEAVETPAGKVRALRVEVTDRASPRSMTTWYDEGLRPVRSEMRGAEGAVEEARAALASESPTPEECRAAVAWAEKHLRGR
jgi:hypothetical protein